jgi:hypothetical protein
VTFSYIYTLYPRVWSSFSLFSLSPRNEGLQVLIFHIHICIKSTSTIFSYLYLLHLPSPSYFFVFRVSLTLPRLAMNPLSSCLCFLSSLDYRHALPHILYIFVLTVFMIHFKIIMCSIYYNAHAFQKQTKYNKIFSYTNVLLFVSKKVMVLTFTVSSFYDTKAGNILNPKIIKRCFHTCACVHVYSF